MDIAIMIEGQNGLTWSRWQKLAEAVEDLGFIGLYRSDHFTNTTAPDLDSLELWTSLTWLASHTNRIEFGPLVSPVSFRNPAMTARMAAASRNPSEALRPMFMPLTTASGRTSSAPASASAAPASARTS